MAITKERKQELVQTYADLVERSQAVVFVTSRGLSVPEVTELRFKLRNVGSRYHVIKNTLFRRALEQVGIPVPEFLQGPLAVGFCLEDIAPTVKAIEDFGESLGEREFAIVGGIVEGEILDAERAQALASMPSKEMLFAQILAGINAPATQLAGVVAAGIRQVLSVLQARVDQLKEAQASA